MIYTRDMAMRLAFLVVPAVAVVGLVLLLNGLNAGAGIAVAAYGVVAVSIGAVLGYFADRLPEPRSERKAHPASLPH